MSAPRKFDQEMRDRAVRMYRDRLEEHGESKLEARRQVGALLDINQATIRNWVEDAERREGARAPRQHRAAGPAHHRRPVHSPSLRAAVRAALTSSTPTPSTWASACKANCDGIRSS